MITCAKLCVVDLALLNPANIIEYNIHKSVFVCLSLIQLFVFIFSSFPANSNAGIGILNSNRFVPRDLRHRRTRLS